MLETGYLKRQKRFVIGNANKYFIFRKKYLFNKKGLNLKTTHLNSFPITLYFKSSGVVAKPEIDSIKKFLMRKLKKNYIFHVTSFYPVTKKSLGVRMGKGKASKPFKYYSAVSKGQYFLSVRRITPVTKFSVIKTCKVIESKLSLQLGYLYGDGW